MHYYKFDISAWALHTAHLSLEEEAVYFRLINFYYDTETPIPIDLAPVLRRLRMASYGTQAAAILEEFFTLSDDGWRHNRCDKELADYHAKVDRNREYGKLGGRPPKQNPNETQTVTDGNPEKSQTTNYKLETTNHKPERKKATVVAAPEGVSDAVWSDYLAVRKAKKAALTPTALKGLEREARKAGIPLEDTLRICCERGWAGFKADWIKDHIDNRIPIRGAERNLAAARAIFGDERQLQAQPDFIVEAGYVNDRTPKIAR